MKRQVNLGPALNPILAILKKRQALLQAKTHRQCRMDTGGSTYGCRQMLMGKMEERVVKTKHQFSVVKL
ncbi:MAG: hypothetical protein ACI9SK_000107 [Zhongshania sp.]|jgi:hypothetical protein